MDTQEPSGDRPSPELARRRTAWHPESEVRQTNSAWAHTTILGGAAIAVFLAGGPRQGSLGIFLAIAGAALVAFPPTIRLGWGIWAFAVGLTVCGALAFLPETWFPRLAWRDTLTACPVINLPATVTVAPEQTAFWWGILALSLCIGLFLLAHPIRSANMITLAAAGAGVCASYAALAAFSRLSGWQYPFGGSAIFGFFPNRNNTAALLVNGLILSVGVLGVAYPRRHYIAGATATASASICAGTLAIFSESRGGVLFAAAGLGLWAAGLGRGFWNRKALLYLGMAVLLGAAIFAVAGSRARDRIVATLAKPKLPGSDLGDEENARQERADNDSRPKIYRDTLTMIGDFPITGSGFGTYPLIYPQYQKASLSDSKAIHPESDWLMLAEEAGLPALVCAGGLSGLLLWRVRSWRSHRYWPLRWGCIVAAATGALHGVLDVPLHRIALGWWILAVAGLSLQTTPRSRQPASDAQARIFLAGGVCAFLLGVLLIRAEWFNGDAFPPFASRRADEQSYAAYEDKRYEQAVEYARQGVQQNSMAAPLYFREGAALLALRGTRQAIENCFEAQRRLNPNWPMVGFNQATVWKDVEAKHTAAAWGEALNRRQRIDQATGAGARTEVDMFNSMMLQAADRPDLQKMLLRETGRGIPLLFAWIEKANPSFASEEIQRLSTNDDFLNRLSMDEKTRFVRDWQARGDRQALAAFLEAHRDWPVASEAAKSL